MLSVLLASQIIAPIDQAITAPAYPVDGSITARIIQVNQQGRTARNASMTIRIGGALNSFPALNNTSTQCFNQPGPSPAYPYGIFLDNSSLNISQCEAYNTTEIVRLSGPLIIDPFTSFTTKATTTEIANAMVARGYLYEIGTTTQAFTITSAGGRDVVFTRTNTNDGNITYTNSIFDSSDAFQVINEVSGQSPRASLLQQAEFVPANVGSGEVYLIDINGDTYEYTAKSGDDVSDVTAGLVAEYNRTSNPNVTCTDQTTRVFCSGTVDTQSFTIDAYVTYPTADIIAPQITLNGSADYEQEYGTSFVDPGASWLDNRDGTGTVMGSGTVDHMTLGTYTLTYSKTDRANNTSSGLTRTVTVADTTAPSLTLIGSGTLTVEIDDGYNDQGANWTDARDGAGIVDADPYTITALGAKTLTYTQVDAAGNTGTISRLLNVVDTIAPMLSLSTTSTTVDANVFPVRGNIGGYGSVTISGGASPVTLSNVNSSFTAYVPLTQNAANTLLITATDLGGNTATGSLIITESGAVNGFSGAISMNVGTLALSGVTSFSGASLTGTTRLVVETPIFFGGKGGKGTIPTNTVITSASGGTGTFDATVINTFNVTVTGGLASNETQQGTVGFGISDTGLHFSKPVKIEIPLTSYSGTTIEVKVRHGGTSTFVTTGLTNNPSATCTNGIPSSPSNVATVVSNTATIYTCAASSFVAYVSTAVASSASTGGGGGGSISSSSTSSVTTTPKPISSTGTVITGTGYSVAPVASKLSAKMGFRSEVTGNLSKITPIKIQTTLSENTRVKVYRIVNKKKILVSTVRVKNGTITIRTKHTGVYEIIKTR